MDADVRMELFEHLKKKMENLGFDFDDMTIFNDIQDFGDGLVMEFKTFHPQNYLMNMLYDKKVLETFLNDIEKLYKEENQKLKPFKKVLDKILDGDESEEKKLKKIIILSFMYFKKNIQDLLKDTLTKDNQIFHSVDTFLNLVENGKYITYENPLYSDEPKEVLKKTIFSDASFTMKEKYIIFLMLKEKYNLPD